MQAIPIPFLYMVDPEISSKLKGTIIEWQKIAILGASQRTWMSCGITQEMGRRQGLNTESESRFLQSKCIHRVPGSWSKV